MKQRVLEAGGRKMTINQWARHLGVAPGTIHARLNLKWSVEQAVGLEKRPAQVAKERAAADKAAVSAAREALKVARKEEKRLATEAALARRKAKEAMWEERIAAAREARAALVQAAADADDLRKLAAAVLPSHPDNRRRNPACQANRLVIPSAHRNLR